MKILILGGTHFLGRHLTESALKAGHEVTLFNRGKTNPGLFKNVEYLKGDRDASDLSALKGRQWDAVVDTCGYVPRVVRESAELLADNVAHYTFISTISVYSDTTQYNMDEGGPLATIEDASREDVTGETYGALKVLCEKAAEAVMPGRVLHVRSGLIVGPHDPTDRFTYWPVRVALGGEILAPGHPNMRVQFIDARDQAEWVLAMAAARKAGIYNVTGPDYNLTMGKLLDTCKNVTRSDATFTWVNDEFLMEHEVGPFSELPLWIPETYNGLQSLNIDKALADGLAFRPLEDTIRDTLKWNSLRTGAEGSIKARAGLMQDREQTLLQAWKERV
ncbi:MAG: SDR family oxidoreductase [Anaerolineae bacterium]|nr:SDR family oxidoreductase [Anaerolineae bacterium]